MGYTSQIVTIEEKIGSLQGISLRRLSDPGGNGEHHVE